MPFHNPTSVGERILVYGKDKSGKSKGWMDIADLLYKTGSDSRFYVGDTDDAVDRMMLEYPHLEQMVDFDMMFDWNDHTKFVDRVLPLLRPQDWLIIDMLDTSWDAVQDHFIQEIFNVDVSDYFIEMRKQFETAREEARKAGKKQDRGGFRAFEGWMDWPVIKKLYKQWIVKVAFRSRCNVYCTAKGDAVNREDDAEIKNQYQAYGLKPVGNKSNPHYFHSIIIASNEGHDRYTMTTVGDRGRDRLDHDEITNFAVDYLVNKAGWRLM